jgi:hypothetical protein
MSPTIIRFFWKAGNVHFDYYLGELLIPEETGGKYPERIYFGGIRI